MFLHETRSLCAKAAFAGAWGIGMIVATAVLIAATSSGQERWQREAGTPTRSEVVMQAAMQRALVSPKSAVMAGNELHERRGF